MQDSWAASACFRRWGCGVGEVGKPSLALLAEHPVNAPIAVINRRVFLAERVSRFLNRPFFDGYNPIGSPGIGVDT